MNLKALLEQRAELVAEMDSLLNFEVREGEETPDLDMEKFNELKAKVEKLDEEIKAIKELDVIKNSKVEEKKGNDEKVEIRERLMNGEEVEIRSGEMSTSTVGGGINKEVVPGVIQKVTEVSPLFAKAHKIDTASNSALTIQGNKLGKFVKITELQEYTKKQATYEEKTIKADKYGMAVVISEELMEDASFDVEAEIYSQLTEGCALAVNELIVDKLEAASNSIKAEGATLDVDTLTEMYFCMKQGYRNGAVWIISPKMEVEIAKLVDKIGQPILIRSFTDRPVMTIFGCEVIVDENCNKPMFVNLDKALTVALRRNINVKRDDSIGFLSGSVAFRGDIRLDAVTTVEEAIVIGNSVVVTSLVERKRK
ncbi:phage major capsid protein [Clostridium perfringens]|uniref:phage major capsid protein n=1 Tax=Clostridium perfringens TaxID=1502 RepID=UPI000D712DFE|nr:phage major capsid protein [Clostridium perfringens]EJT6612781.1 phage major capsid protein [Clostridium perfringens]MDM0826368.1 phage major capsid protein [Clostridium perfringens]MDM0866512.1 phage major capsid protein [Clostridium perfringens]PWW86430.1 phage major capsid protein [Clostridium perfringens]